MIFLLDTCALIYLVANPDRLKTGTRELLEATDSRLIILAASAWEIACACQRKRLELDRSWSEWFRYYTGVFDCAILPITLDLIEIAESLPEPIHKDPIDRLIIAQAIKERAVVVTTDLRIRHYTHVQSID